MDVQIGAFFLPGSAILQDRSINKTFQTEIDACRAIAIGV